MRVIRTHITQLNEVTLEELLPTLPSLEAKLLLMRKWHRFFKGLLTYLLHELVALVLPETAEVSTATGTSCGILTIIRSRYKLNNIMLHNVTWRLERALSNFDFSLCSTTFP